LWWLAIVVLPFLLAAIPLGLYALMGGSLPELPLLAQPWMVVPIFLTYFCTGGGNEEWGWRGYALDRLQARWSPLVTSLILGLIWGAWHIPLFFIESTGQYHMSMGLFLFSTLGMSILHTWVYNGAGRNLLAAWVFHAAYGTAWEVLPIIQPEVAGYGRVQIYGFTFAVIVAVLVVLIAGPGLCDRRGVGSAEKGG
jgi:membrane protease YdiL (CAAX protease family)